MVGRSGFRVQTRYQLVQVYIYYYTRATVEYELNICRVLHSFDGKKERSRQQFKKKKKSNMLISNT